MTTTSASGTNSGSEPVLTNPASNSAWPTSPTLPKRNDGTSGSCANTAGTESARPSPKPRISTPPGRWQAATSKCLTAVDPPKHSRRVRSLTPAADAASRYPDIVALTSLLASLFWRRIVISHDPIERDRFFDEIRRRVLDDYVQTTTSYDYLARWANEQRQHHTLDTLIDTLFASTSVKETS